MLKLLEIGVTLAPVTLVLTGEGETVILAVCVPSDGIVPPFLSKLFCCSKVYSTDSSWIADYI